jgi:hypothetical protein
LAARSKEAHAEQARFNNAKLIHSARGWAHLGALGFSGAAAEHSCSTPTPCLMKGEVIDPYTVWCGNPATLSRHHVPIDRLASGHRAPLQEMAGCFDPRVASRAVP